MKRSTKAEKLTIKLILPQWSMSLYQTLCSVTVQSRHLLAPVYDTLLHWARSDWIKIGHPILRTS